MRTTTRTLLLAGHGSSFDRESAAPVYAHAARIRQRRLFDEVHVAFWKQAPWLHSAMRAITTEVAYVVPMFMAEGYFTREVVPRELGKLDSVRLGRPVGTHPGMAGLVLKRALAIDATRDNTALVIVGHGTERSATSGNTVLGITGQLSGERGFAAVKCGFLDQEPRIERVVAAVRADRVILVPFFLSDGHHTRITLPEALSRIANRELIYTRAVGTLPEVAALAVDQLQLADSKGE